ncbi:MAG: MFS transporter [Melioribacteraceae bacterium]|nr:MFS transporter [Melioribacteraceae bacterium]MCO6473265.1 MFS transporter [Melioribacteraceae bacterium]
MSHYQEDHQTPKNSKSKIFIWTLFDFANTSYSIVVVTFIFAVYFKEVISLAKPVGDLYWSIGISVSMIITAIISPVLGAIADFSAGKKRFLLFFTLLSISATALLFFIGEGMIFWGLILFIAANIGFEAGLVFYDAFLPEITTAKNYGRVSGYGFAMGYLGSLVILAICLPFIKAEMIRETFPLSAGFFLLFSLPLFFWLKDSRKNRKQEESYIKIGFNRVAYTLKHLKNYKNLALFLASFFLYIEGVNTVIFFSGNYARTTLKFSFEELIIFFLIVQTTAILGSVVFGIIGDSIGQKKAISISLFIWIFTVIFAFATSTTDNFFVEKLSSIFNSQPKDIQRNSFYIVGLIAGSVMGATQSTSRSLMSKLTPIEKRTEFFGFYSFFGKSSAIVGPLAFGLVSFITESQSFAILTLIVFFIAGVWLLQYVKDPKLPA